MPTAIAPRDRNDFQVALFCALSLEAENVQSVFDICWEDQDKQYGKAAGDQNSYTTGAIGKYNVVLVHMPDMGGNSAAVAAAGVRSSFRGIRLALVVGICGAVPVHPTTKKEIVLGDVVISTAVVQYDLGRQYPKGFKRKKEVEDSLGRANPEIRAFINMLTTRQNRERFNKKVEQLVTSNEFRAEAPAATYPGALLDRLYESSYIHQHRSGKTCDKCLLDVGTCSRNCDELECEDNKLVIRYRHSLEMKQPGESGSHAPYVHLGRFASANTVMKSGMDRDRISAADEVTAFEMEGAGVWEQYPTIVIKAACDYADSHKSKKWQGYAAAVAAACLKVFLKEWIIPEQPSDRDELREPVERPETPPLPSSTVPFRRDIDFVDREAVHNCETLLEQIEQKCSVAASRVALVGIGGVGKSQLAIEYCHRLRERSPDMWVFWIHASNADRIEQGFRQVADRVRIPGRKNPKENIFDLVARWLRDKTKGKWLLVLDNLDENVVLPRPQETTSSAQSSYIDEQSQRSLSTYLPQSEQGGILITTRTSSVIAKLVESRDMIVVDPMTETDSIALLKKKLHAPADDNDLRELTRILENMPLAIVQAAAYIQQRGARYSVQRYIEVFQRSEKQITILLGYEAGHLRRDPDAKNSILITWQISFDRILETRRSAADLLSLMSFFDRQGIAEALLRHRIADESRRDGADRLDQEQTHFDDSSAYQSNSDDEEFEEDILVLRNYYFVSLNVDTTTFEMHGLVQFATRKWLETHGQLEKWKQLYIRNLFKEFPGGEYENWVSCEAIFPHAKSAMSQQPEGDDALCEWASVLYRAAWYAVRKGNVVDAERMSKMALEARRKIFGEDHKETLNSMDMVGQSYSLGGRWHEAEKLELQVLETRKSMLGPDHLDTLGSVSSLASTYRNLGRWKEAEELEVHVMEVTKRVLGTEHLDTLNSMSNLASTYAKQGRWKEAEELDIQVARTSEKMLGVEHPDTLSALASLASTYRYQGRWKDAEELEVWVVKTMKRVLGIDHPVTLNNIGGMAATYRAQGRWQEAEEQEIQVIETMKKVLGPDHPDTLVSMGNLALTYLNQGRWKEAEELQLRMIEIMKRVLGEEHPDTLAGINNLASTYAKQGRRQETEELFLYVLEMRKSVQGTEHPSTLTALGNLASTYRAQGRWQEAEELEVQVMETRRSMFGTDHISTLTSMINLASTYKEQGRAKEAEELVMQAIEISKRALSVEHPFMLISMEGLASMRGEQGQWKEAEELEMKVMEIRKRVFGFRHPDTLRSMASLAMTYMQQDRLKEAEDLQVQIIEIRKTTLSLEDEDMLSCMSNLASTYGRQGRWKEAEELQVQVVEIEKRVLGPEHPSTLISMNNLAITLGKLGQQARAEELRVYLVETRLRILGPEHPDTLISLANLAVTHQEQDRWQEAEELQVQVMETTKRVLSPEHPKAIERLRSLAWTYMNQHRWKEAELLYLQVMETTEKVLGAEHPSTLAIVSNVGWVLELQEKYEQAEEMYRRAMAGREKVLGVAHPDTLKSISSLADLLGTTQNYREAVTLYDRAIIEYSRILGQEHPTTKACQEQRALLAEKAAASADPSHAEPTRGNEQERDAPPTDCEICDQFDQVD